MADQSVMHGLLLALLNWLVFALAGWFGAKAFMQSFAGDQAVVVTKEGRRLVENGNVLSPELLQADAETIPGGQLRVYDSTGRFYGIYQHDIRSGVIKPVKMFLSEGT